jgi:hypothetical protein
MSAVWPQLFQDAYGKWAILGQAAADGDALKVAEMIKRGASVDLPFEWSPSATSMMILVAADLCHQSWRSNHAETRGAQVPRWKAVPNDEFELWFDPTLHTSMTRVLINGTPITANGKNGDDGSCLVAAAAIAEAKAEAKADTASAKGEKVIVTREVDINQLFNLLPPSHQQENQRSVAGIFAVLREQPDGEMEDWAHFVHEQWLDRRREEGPTDECGNQALPQWVIDNNQHLPYKDLSEEEKERDRILVRLCVKLKSDKRAGNGPSPTNAGGGGVKRKVATPTPKIHKANSVSEKARLFDAAAQDLASASGGVGGNGIFTKRKRASYALSLLLRIILSRDSSSLLTHRRTTEPLQAAVHRYLTTQTLPQCLPSPPEDDAVIRLLVEAGANPIVGVNLPILGDPAIDDEVVFSLLRYLLRPLHDHHPHTLDFLRNDLAESGARRLLRFFLANVRAREAAAAAGGGGHGNGGSNPMLYPKMGSPAGARAVTTSTIRATAPGSSSEPHSPLGTIIESRGGDRQIGPCSATSSILGLANPDPPLLSLCGLSQEALLRMQAVSLREDEDDDEGDDDDDDDDHDDENKNENENVDSGKVVDQGHKDGAVSITKFQMVRQPDFGPASFSLLLAEILGISADEDWVWTRENEESISGGSQSPLSPFLTPSVVSPSPVPSPSSVSSRFIIPRPTPTITTTPVQPPRMKNSSPTRLPQPPRMAYAAPLASALREIDISGQDNLFVDVSRFKSAPQLCRLSLMESPHVTGEVNNSRMVHLVFYKEMLPSK